jgi:predicted permease
MPKEALREMLARLWNLFRRKRLDAELDAEVRHHLESLEAEHRARGLSEHEARAAARRDFGGLAQIQESYRDQRGIPMLETSWRDIRFGVRSILRTRGVTLAVIATLGIGIGANTTVFSIINGILIKPLPFPDSDRLINVAHAAPGVNIDDLGSAPFLYLTEREENRTLEGIALWGRGGASVTGNDESERVETLAATADFLPMLGIAPELGRVFSEEDNAMGSQPTVILTYSYWQRRFGGDRSAIGKTLTVDGQVREVIGVMPQNFTFLNGDLDLLFPFPYNWASVTSGAPYYFPSIAKLKPGVTLEDARADIARIIPMAMERFPLRPGTTIEQFKRTRLAPNLRLLKQDVVGDAGNMLWAVMGAIGMVLLIACANVANLILVRTDSRQQELSIRAALGAGWSRIARELLTENAILSLAGGVLGVAITDASLRLLLALGPGNLPRLNEITLDGRVLLFALGATILSALLFGIIPVVRYARPRLAPALRTGLRTSSRNRQKSRAQSALVVVQVALALVLLIGAGLMIRSFEKLTNVETGFSRPEELQVVQLDIPVSVAPDPQHVVRLQNDVLDRLAALPGVISAAYISNTPMRGNTLDLLAPEGRVFKDGDRPRPTEFKLISPGFFETAGVPLLLGRDIAWTDLYERRPVALISENLAKREWGSPEAALGKRLRGGSTTDDWREIVGVVANTRDNGLAESPTELVYVPGLANRIFTAPLRVQRTVALLIRSTRTGAPGFLDEIRNTVSTVEHDLTSWAPTTMAEIYRDSTERTSFTLVMLAIAGGMALLLGVIGIYAVIAYGVSQRTREVGIRMALGAQRQEVQRLFLRRGLALTAVGVAAGLGGAAALTRWISSLLFEVSALDPMTYGIVSLVILAAAWTASYLPSRRATRVDPIQALRTD